MALENKTYVPTLAVRPSEMNGLEFLPGAAKDRITPCFLLAPWANSSSLERTCVRIARAYPNRAYFLDIDPDYHPTNTDSTTQAQLERLKDSSGSYANWVSFVREQDFVQPCLQTTGLNSNEIRRQIDQFQNAGRSYCVRIVYGRHYSNLNDIVDALSASGSADFTIILEGGWTNDPLTLSAWFEGLISRGFTEGLISRGFTELSADVPFVVSCTSIPSLFTSFNGNAPFRVTFTNRELVEQIARNTNRSRIVYGDWGSTRPRSERGMASRPLDRIDYPTDRAWLIARNKDDEWTFRDAALAICGSPDWNGNLGIWGEEMIQNTTVNPTIGIDTPQKNVAARVNIHLYRQAFFGSPIPNPAALDEDWQD